MPSLVFKLVSLIFKLLLLQLMRNLVINVQIFDQGKKYLPTIIKNTLKKLKISHPYIYNIFLKESKYF